MLGSTGSIGTQALDVVSRLPERLKVVSMAAHRNVELLAEQVREYKPSLVSIGSEKDAAKLRELLGDVSGLKIVCGDEGLRLCATADDADTTVVAVAGTVGLAPTIAAIEAGKEIALASKEALVAAGGIVSRMVREKGVRLLPIDSEHSAIFQCLQGENRGSIRRLLLTASGGSFKNRPVDELENATVDEALAHPTWTMGRKITIDSATLMNKALEVIEAHWLFGVDISQIEVVIHPQSIVHSMVEFEDGSVIAQLGVPDMRVPIQYALLYPERVHTELPRLDITQQSALTFAKPDAERYPGLELAYMALASGGTMPAVLNAANEIAVWAFLDGKTGFLDIQRTVRRVMHMYSPVAEPELTGILEADKWARLTATRLVEDGIG